MTTNASGLPTEHASHLVARQLAILRTTYPGWEIQRVYLGPGEVTWTATLRRDTTASMRAAGVAPHIERTDAPSLASVLALQAALIHNHRAHVWPA
ncbi:hypothetical protein ACGF0J_19930 [Nonomuraea sp. NPDC047897]|uniref:hypothetical protein n=1 Tax=Nonomuraea sp. NPDC047897 TaxID=3364346 RepID=UPI0037154EC6